MTRQTFEDEEQPSRVPGWALTYIDLLWLLLLFFILQCAVSEIGEGPRYRAMKAAMQKRFGSESALEAKDKNAKSAAYAKDRTQYGEIVREGLDERAEARKRSLLRCGVLYFPDGREKLQNEQRQILQAVAKQIGPSPATIEIRGEAAEKMTDAEKAGQAEADPVYTRCVATRDYLAKLGIEPNRLRITLSGERCPPGEKPRVLLYSVTEIVAEKPGKTAVKR